MPAPDRGRARGLSGEDDAGSMVRGEDLRLLWQALRHGPLARPQAGPVGRGRPNGRVEPGSPAAGSRGAGPRSAGLLELPHRRNLPARASGPGGRPSRAGSRPASTRSVKGTGFSPGERLAFGLEGLLPEAVRTLEQQERRACANIARKEDPLEQYIGLAALQDRNEHLFYRPPPRPSAGAAAQRLHADRGPRVPGVQPHLPEGAGPLDHPRASGAHRRRARERPLRRRAAHRGHRQRAHPRSRRPGRRRHGDPHRQARALHGRGRDPALADPAHKPRRRDRQLGAPRGRPVPRLALPSPAGPGVRLPGRGVRPRRQAPLPESAPVGRKVAPGVPQRARWDSSEAHAVEGEQRRVTQGSDIATLARPSRKSTETRRYLTTPGPPGGIMRWAALRAYGPLTRCDDRATRDRHAVAMVASRNDPGDDRRLLGAVRDHRLDVYERPPTPVARDRHGRRAPLRRTDHPSRPGDLPEVRPDGARDALGPRRLSRPGLQRGVSPSPGRDLQRFLRSRAHRPAPCRGAGRGGRGGDEPDAAGPQAEPLRSCHRRPGLHLLRGSLPRRPAAGVERVLPRANPGAGTSPFLHQGPGRAEGPHRLLRLGALGDGTPAHFHDRALSGWKLTPSQWGTGKFLGVVAALFLLQGLAGGALAHYRVEPGAFYGIDIASLLPYNLLRTWHLQLAIFWIATAWVGGGLFLAPLVGRQEPKG